MMDIGRRIANSEGRGLRCRFEVIFGTGPGATQVLGG